MSNVHHHHQLNIPDPLRVEMTTPTTPAKWQQFWRGLGKYAADIFKLAIPIFGALYGYNYVNALTQQREQENRLKTTRIEANIQAFDSLSRSFILYKKYNLGHTELQSALARIQLSGNADQIRMISSLNNEKKSGKYTQLDPIIQSVRNSLREDLGLEPDNSPIIVIREVPGVAKSEISAGLWVECESYTGRFYKLPWSKKSFDILHFDESMPFAEYQCPLCRDIQTIYKRQIIVKD